MAGMQSFGLLDTHLKLVGHIMEYLAPYDYHRLLGHHIGYYVWVGKPSYGLLDLLSMVCGAFYRILRRLHKFVVHNIHGHQSRVPRLAVPQIHAWSAMLWNIEPHIEDV